MANAGTALATEITVGVLSAEILARSGPGFYPQRGLQPSRRFIF
jgi:hypothetical protein